MKKVYENLQIEVISFEKKDVITASGEVVISKIEYDNGHISFNSLHESSFWGV